MKLTPAAATSMTTWAACGVGAGRSSTASTSGPPFDVTTNARTCAAPIIRPYGGYRWGVQPVAYLPSPSQSVWHLGPIPIRAYALCIVAGIFVALWLAARRMRARGGKSEDVWDVAGWAIAFGIIGGRLYHLITDPELYFEGKPGTSPIDAIKIW